MSPWRRPSLLGALIWIGLGVLFLLRNFGIGPDFWWLVGHYWPVLLILLGLGKVLEYLLHKQSISVHFGEIFGIILLILIGSAVSRLSASHFGQIFRNLPTQFGRMSGENHTFSEDGTYPLEKALPILVENSLGSVSIIPGNDKEIRVRLKKVIYANEVRARDIAPQIHLEAKPELRDLSTTTKAEAEPGKKTDVEYFVIRTNRDSLSSQDLTFNTNLEVTIPKNSQLQVRNSTGEIRVSEIDGNLDLSTTQRDVEVRDCTGQFKISTRYAESRLTNLVGNVNLDSRGKVYIDGVKGDVTATDEYESLEIRNVDGKVQVSTNEGKIHLENIAKPVIIDSRGTEVDVQDLQDSLKISASHRNVDIANVDSNVAIESSYASISLKGIKGNLDIRSNSDSINAADIGGSLRLRARGSGIRVNEIRGPLDVQTTLKDVTVDDFADSCIITNEYAGISASSHRLGRGDVVLKNRNGDVDLFIPEDASFAIDATARNGRVESNYEGLKPRSNADTGVLKSRVKTGGPNISLETNYGSIRIHPNQGEAENPPINNNVNVNSTVWSQEAMQSDLWLARLRRYIFNCIQKSRLAGIGL
jgi:DUF4097 and DUF4098 domain-containing protein YvlB